MQVHVLCASGAALVICPLAPFGSVWPVEAVRKLHQSAAPAQATSWLHQVRLWTGVGLSSHGSGRLDKLWGLHEPCLPHQLRAHHKRVWGQLCSRIGQPLSQDEAPALV